MSVVVMNKLREQVSQLEVLIGSPTSDNTMSLVIHNEHEHISLLNSTQRDCVKDYESQFASIINEFSSFVEMVKDNFKDMETEVAVLKRALSQPSPRSDRAGASKVKVPKPKCFSGARYAKELENFLWDVEQYFKATQVPEGEQVTLTSMYLSGDANLWWHTRMEDDVSTGRPQIETWETLKKELKDQFLPLNMAWVAKESLKNLKYTGTVRDYVKDFSYLMLYIKNMSEEDKLFNFLSGL